MKLGQFLATVPKDSAPREQVKFRVIGTNNDGHQVSSEAYAGFRLVSEKLREEAEIAAWRELLPLREPPKDDATGGLGLIPENILQAARQRHVLAEALRDHDSPREAFATAAELRTGLADGGIDMLWAKYEAWVLKHYPPPTKADREALKGEAGK